MVFDFGYRLKNLRQQHHLTQTQVANRLNLSKTSISGYENNVKTPSQDVLIKLAGLYRVSTDYLLGLDDEEMISVEGLTRQQRRLVEELVRMLQEKPRSWKAEKSEIRAEVSAKRRAGTVKKRVTDTAGAAADRRP